MTHAGRQQLDAIGTVNASLHVVTVSTKEMVRSTSCWPPGMCAGGLGLLCCLQAGNEQIKGLLDSCSARFPDLVILGQDKSYFAGTPAVLQAL